MTRWMRDLADRTRERDEARERIAQLRVELHGRIRELEGERDEALAELDRIRRALLYALAIEGDR